jgi:hypothetical protein
MTSHAKSFLRRADAPVRIRTHFSAPRVVSALAGCWATAGGRSPAAGRRRRRTQEYRHICLASSGSQPRRPRSSVALPPEPPKRSALLRSELAQSASQPEVNRPWKARSRSKIEARPGTNSARPSADRALGHQGRMTFRAKHGGEQRTQARYKLGEAERPLGFRLGGSRQIPILFLNRFASANMSTFVNT